MQSDDYQMSNGLGTYWSKSTEAWLLCTWSKVGAISCASCDWYSNRIRRYSILPAISLDGVLHSFLMVDWSSKDTREWIDNKNTSIKIIFCSLHWSRGTTFNFQSQNSLKKFSPSNAPQLLRTSSSLLIHSTLEMNTFWTPLLVFSQLLSKS